MDLLPFDDQLPDAGMLEALLADDPRTLRAEGGLPWLCESLCDAFVDVDAEFNAAAIEAAVSPGSALQGGSSGTLATASSGASNDRPLDGAALGQAADGSAAAAALPPVVTLPPAAAVPAASIHWKPRSFTSPLAPPASLPTHDPGGASFAAFELPSTAAREAPPPKPRSRGQPQSKNPSAATLAQRRYHERQKAKRLDSERRLQAMTAQMQALQVEKEELELRNRILTRDLAAWQDHLEEMWGNKEIRRLQQQMVLALLAALMGRAAGRHIPLAEAEAWTFEEYATVHFRRFMERLAELAPIAIRDPTSPEHAECCALVTAYRDLDKNGGQSSCLHWGCVSYNLGESARPGRTAPTPEFWAAILDAACLSEAQIDQLLSYHERLCAMLTKCAARRNDEILPQLGLEAARLPKEQMHKCPAASALYQSYRKEQTGCIGLLLLKDRVLSKPQAALVEAAAYPWCPEWLPMLAVLRARRGLPPLRFPAFRDRGMDLPVLPCFTAYEIMVRPITGIGIGGRMRHGVILCPFETVLSSACFPCPPQERVARMKVLDVFLGSWRELTCWEWMQKVRQLDRIVPNSLVPEASAAGGASCGVFRVDSRGAMLHNAPPDALQQQQPGGRSGEQPPDRPADGAA